MQRVLRETLAGGKFGGVAAKRTKHMRSIRSKGNRSTERRLRAYLIQSKVRGWTVHPKDIPGTPEFVFHSEKVAIFTDGCFWHGCQRCGKVPRTRASYWTKKIQLNIERDRKDESSLLALGFQVIRLWEHELRDDPSGCIERIVALLTNPILSRRRGKKQRRISRPSESFVRPPVLGRALEVAYQQMAQNEAREAEAQDWAEASVADVSDETR